MNEWINKYGLHECACVCVYDTQTVNINDPSGFRQLFCGSSVQKWNLHHWEDNFQKRFGTLVKFSLHSVTLHMSKWQFLASCHKHAWQYFIFSAVNFSTLPVVAEHKLDPICSHKRRNKGMLDLAECESPWLIQYVGNCVFGIFMMVLWTYIGVPSCLRPAYNFSYSNWNIGHVSKMLWLIMLFSSTSVPLPQQIRKVWSLPEVIAQNVFTLGVSLIWSDL